MDMIFIIILAFLLDALIGDPQNPLHPVRLMGAVISAAVMPYKKLKPGKTASFILGAALSVSLVTGSYLITKIIIDAASSVNYILGFCANVVLCYFIIAPKALQAESMKVYGSLMDNDLDGARRNLSYIVGRDTANLNSPGIVKAAVETVAENLSDGVIAPLLFACIGGVPFGMAYKAVNTLDSMIGYKNETYEYFGKFAARLDDAVNFIPARISALAMLAASAFTGGSFPNAVKIYLRDRHNHKSPNSAQTEAVCAGTLGIALGGDNYYNGVLVHKPTIGDNLIEPQPCHIISANRLMYATAMLTIIAMLLISIAGRYLNV